jgi:hypothetical protein
LLVRDPERVKGWAAVIVCGSWFPFDVKHARCDEVDGARVRDRCNIDLTENFLAAFERTSNPGFNTANLAHALSPNDNFDADRAYL